MRVIFTYPDGRIQPVEADPGINLMEAAIWNDVPNIEATCGGNCTCATCHVFVDDAWLNSLPQADGLEQALLSNLHGAEANSRLSCQIILSDALDGLAVKVPSAQPGNE